MSLAVVVQSCLSLILATFSVVESRNFQIVGGQLANIEDSPYQVVYFSDYNFVCSGSLISPTFVLTAAHCTRNNPFFIVVGLGSSYRNRGGITVDVDEFFQHPNYNPQNYDFDFSLLKLHEAVRYTRYIQPAVLPTANTVFPVGTQCTVSGWGLRKFDDEDSPPKQLLAAEIEISDFRYCKGNYSKVSNVITDRMICAGTLDGSRDACLGDSGGPLVCKGVLYGVVSFGHGCALKNFPGIYSKITSALPWIKKVARIP